MRFIKCLIAAIFLALAACAQTVPVDVSTTALAVATHNDLLAAAQYADTHGYAARAAVWRAHDTHLTAVEAQISACANAIEASLPKPIDPNATLTPFLAVEIGAEAVGEHTGVPPEVSINCAPLPLILLPALPIP